MHRFQITYEGYETDIAELTTLRECRTKPPYDTGGTACKAVTS